MADKPNSPLCGQIGNICQHRKNPGIIVILANIFFPSFFSQMEAIERLHFLASFDPPSTGKRKGGEKTQPFNRFHSHPGTFSSRSIEILLFDSAAGVSHGINARLLTDFYSPGLQDIHSIINRFQLLRRSTLVKSLLMFRNKTRIFAD